MAHGKTKGTIYAKFAARVAELESVAEKMSKQFRNGSALRPWHVPKDNKSTLDVPTMHMPAWDRFEINRAYSEDLLSGPANGGTCGDLLAAKIQADFMAVEERAYRTRHASYVRSAAHAHGQLAGHGQKDRSIFAFIRDSLKMIIKRGGVTR